MPLSSAKWIAQRKLQLTEIPSTEMKLPNLKRDTQLQVLQSSSSAELLTTFVIAGHGLMTSPPADFIRWPRPARLTQ